MKALRAAALAIAALSAACATTAPAPTPAGTSGALFDTVAALDSAVFAAFNTCADAEQLRKHAEYFAADIEFYHDTGGVTWNREAMLANTAKYACGNFRRELVTGSLRVYPVKDFGAIAQGEHKFCQFKTGACEGAADFLIVWRNEGGTWRITRVMSYGHRPL